MTFWGKGKGHGAEVKAFVKAVKNGGSSPILFEEIVEVMKTTISLAVEGK
jgi:hypothetical protein